MPDLIYIYYTRYESQYLCDYSFTDSLVLRKIKELGINTVANLHFRFCTID